MSVKLLIEGIVQQTTVLIAQLSTSAGIRAPLSHIADQVFVSLAREIHAQGVRRKVAADMFGMALRAYQLKVQRLTESSSVRDRTLWEAVLDFVAREKSVARGRVLERFASDGEKETSAVLNDLVSSGLLHCTGRGAAMLYGMTTESERRRFTETADQESLRDMAWGLVYREPGLTSTQLAANLGCAAEAMARALQELKQVGRVQSEASAEAAQQGNDALKHGSHDEETRWFASHFLVRVGTEHGWESAVLDHFQAVTRAIAIKLADGALSAKHNDVVGGSTLRFQLSPGHPFARRVLETLRRERKQLNELWQQVSDYNDAKPISAEQRVDVCFYYGQSVSGEGWGALSELLLNESLASEAPQWDAAESQNPSVGNTEQAQA